MPLRLAILSLLLMPLLAACSPDGTEDASAPATAPEARTEAAESEQGPAAEADASFPELQIATLDGSSYDLVAHRGKWVVVNFWATWCKPCVKEMPDLSALDADNEHIEVLGLAYDDSEPEDIRAFLQAHPVSYPIAIVDTFDPPKAFATPRGLPTTYLIAPDGRLKKKFMGPVTPEIIHEAIAAAGDPNAG